MKKSVFFFLLACCMAIATPTFSQSYEELVEMAIAAAQADSLRKSEALYKQALKINPNDYRNALVHHSLGHVEELIYWSDPSDTKILEEAVYHYSQAVEMQPESVLMRFSRADLYLNLKNYGKAVLDYSDIIKKDPANTEALNRRGFAYFQMREYDKARADYERVLKQKPSDYLSALGVALVLQKTNKTSEAITRMGFLMAAYPDNPDLYEVRASMYEDLEKYELALLDLTKAIEMDPSNPDRYIRRAELYEKMGKATHARNDRRKAQKLLEEPPQHVMVPEAPDYNDPTMWYTVDGDSLDTGADIFYIVSTWEEDWTTGDGTICHYADVWNPTHRQHMATEISGVGNYMAPGNHFYAPFYRHTTINTFLTANEDTISSRTRISMDDVCRAFDAFQKQRDQSRPLIIAGFSQGGMAVVQLLKHMDDEAYSQLAAAYVMGYKVTQEDISSCSHIRPAKGEADTGVTICYNTVKDVKFVNPVISATDIGINPVNWKTDATPAVLHDSITVTLSPEYHVLVVSGYSGSEYRPYRNFINVGDIHSCEPWLYSDCIKRNINIRAKQWRAEHLLQ